jgi:outer membrane receptor protein involved in Fe transport
MIEDSIVEVERSDFVVQGQLWDEAGTYINADDSSIMGLEFSVQTAMENGLLFAFNYTYADGETDLPADSVSGERTIPYFKQAQDTANMVFGYDKGAWDVRLAFNYRSEYLDEVSDGPLFDRYTSEYVSADLTARYQMTENLQLSAAALNLSDRPEFYYFGNEKRLSQYDEYGVTYTMGLRYVF